MYVTFLPGVKTSQINMIALSNSDLNRQLKSNARVCSVEPCRFAATLFSVIEAGIQLDNKEIICPLEEIGFVITEKYERAIAYNPHNSLEMLFKFSWEQEPDGNPSLVVYNPSIMMEIIDAAVKSLAERIRLTAL